MTAPLFIFSLPRAGSTLLQRTLMGHSKIKSVAEPWILLPHIYATKAEGTLAEYSSYTALTGINDFLQNLPNKEQDYKVALQSFMLELYGKQCTNDEVYFLDKTPRYYLIIDEIVDLFPNAKFIFLFRNPLHVYASVVSTWGKGRFNKLFSVYHDLQYGFGKISEGYTKHSKKSLAVNYEAFVLNPQEVLNRILGYLELEADDCLTKKFFEQDTKGTLGDPTGVKEYNEISTQSLSKWKKVFNSRIRKFFAITLLRKINEDHYKTQGYSLNTIVRELKSSKNTKATRFFRDIFDFFISYIMRKFQGHLFLDKKFSWFRKKYIS